MTSIWWIRRDLRLANNPALHAALDESPVVPVFLLDPAFAHASARRKGFLYEGLHALDKSLRTRGSYLVVRSGRPLEALKRLQTETGAETIYAEEDFTPYARKRDADVARHLPLQLIHGQTVHHPGTILKKDGRPYTVFTAYSLAWKTRNVRAIDLLPAPQKVDTPVGIWSEAFPKYRISPLFPAGEEEALARLDQFLQGRIYRYGEARERMDLEGTSALSPYLRFGMLGMRQAVSAARQAFFETRNEFYTKNAEAWLNELIWREFYIQILYHFPHVRKRSFKPALENIRWRNNESEFAAWKQGRTGVPIVDAGMRQLQEIGWMHNRARMIAASYLVKDLLIDWRWGEAWFMENLLDGDLAANNGGWQWTAGTGTDAAPYFRIFNPVLQSTKFDPHGEYIRKWVPELRALHVKEIHAPWEHGIRVPGYPEKPIAERNIERTLQVYRSAKEIQT